MSNYRDQGRYVLTHCGSGWTGERFTPPWQSETWLKFTSINEAAEHRLSLGVFGLHTWLSWLWYDIRPVGEWFGVFPVVELVDVP